MGEEFNSGAHAAVWVSETGLDWSRISGHEAVFEYDAGSNFDHAVMHDVTLGGPGLVAVGARGPVFREDAAVWVSADGFIWESVTTSGDLGDSSVQQMFGVTTGGPGLVAVGLYSECSRAVFECVGEENYHRDAAAWVSADGLTWTRISP